MSPIRIILGTALGSGALLLGLAATWHWSLPIWITPVLLLGSAIIFATIKSEARRRAMLRPYWSRNCMGIRWRRRFPTAPKTEIRRFLDFFLDAFGFPACRRSCFSPEDKILDVYHAAYPPGYALADCLDLETFAGHVQKHYGIDLRTVWHANLTLGDLYARTHHLA